MQQLVFYILKYQVTWVFVSYFNQRTLIYSILFLNTTQCWPSVVDIDLLFTLLDVPCPILSVQFSRAHFVFIPSVVRLNSVLLLQNIQLWSAVDDNSVIYCPTVHTVFPWLKITQEIIIYEGLGRGNRCASG